MPINRIWNNLIDAAEVTIKKPISEEDLDGLGFPASSYDWLVRPTDLMKGIDKEACAEIYSLAMNAAVDSHITLQKIEPKDTNFDSPRWYVVFETVPKIAPRLDLSAPDWIQIQNTLEFSVSNAFISFSEAWPGLIFEGLDRPAFLLECSDLLRHESLSTYDEQCNPKIDKELLARLQNMLLFQIDYWANAKLLDHKGIVWEYKIDRCELSSTELEFSNWLNHTIASKIKET